MNKITEAPVSRVRDKTISSPSFFTDLWIAMRAKCKEQFDAINAHLALFPDPGELEYFSNEHTSELKSKANKNKIKKYIIRQMKALAGHVNKMEVAQKTLIDRT